MRKHLLCSSRSLRWYHQEAGGNVRLLTRGLWKIISLVLPVLSFRLLAIGQYEMCRNSIDMVDELMEGTTKYESSAYLSKALPVLFVRLILFIWDLIFKNYSIGAKRCDEKFCPWTLNWNRVHRPRPHAGRVSNKKMCVSRREEQMRVQKGIDLTFANRNEPADSLENWCLSKLEKKTKSICARMEWGRWNDDVSCNATHNGKRRCDGLLVRRIDACLINIGPSTVHRRGL